MHKKLFFNILIILGILLVVLPFAPVIKDEIWYFFKNLTGKKYILTSEASQAPTVFGKYLDSKPVYISPVNRTFSLIIEKIGVNVPVVKDVPISDSVAYTEALKHGVAHAGVSKYPSKDIGNVYLFAHASVDFWELGGYATIFNLLRKLEVGDSVHVFFENKDYVYIVQNKEVLPGWNTYPILRPVLDPTLTLQTCDPPGTTLNRLVVTAVLKEIRE
jgi:sortase A